MVRVASQLIAAAALAQIQRVAGAASTLRGVPDLVELEAVDGGVFVGRQDLAAYGNPGDVDCVLSDWEPKGECDAKTLTQVFERHIVTQPENDGLACEALEKTMPCKPVHCQMGPWKEWSACDENGFKTRKRDMLVPPKYGGRSCPFDEDKVKCRKQDCRVCEWSAWKCNDKNGKKTRTRHVTRPKELDGADCPPLEEEEVCDPVDCKYNPDKFEEWSKCDAITFMRTQRNVVIEDAKYNGKACPVKEERCPPVNCKYYDKATNNDDFGECVPDDETKMVWHRHKIYEVEQEAMYGGEDCDPKLGDITELCEPVDCDYKSAEDSTGEDYGSCEEDKEDGKWYKTKKLDVKTNPLYGGEECHTNGKGYDKKECEPIKCEYDTVENSRKPTDKCEDDGSGTWYKTITRKIKIHAQYGGEDCDPKDLYHKEECPKVDCKYDTLANSKKPTDKCEDDGNGKWYKTIKLDVITEAEYGGEPCHENGKGFDKEFCEPVNCDLGPFGDWTECNGKGKKEQWRDLLSPALYGGTCESQVGEDTCTPQECIVAEDEEDDDWGDCQADGFKYKTLRIKQHPRFGAADCPDEKARTRKKPCKVIDCVAGDWSEWGRCNSEGKRKRTRDILVDKKFGGKVCPELEEVESCDLVPCVLDDWSPWTKCDENMKRSRTRHVLVESNHGTCEPETQTEDCKKVDCKVGDWEKWGECKEDGYYGPMKQSRTRPVLIEPKNGGAECPALSQTQFCGSNDCHVGDWEPWGQCKNGWKKRTRKCHQKKRGGQDCDPEIHGNEERAPCAEDCVVTEWSDPSPCNAEGKSVSERKIVIPASGGGAECPTDLKKEEPCPAVNCVLNGWSQWGTCDSTTYTRTRHREVLLEPKHGGTSCPDAESPARKRTEECPKVDCVVSDWSGWSKCDEELKQTRTKTKLAEPLNGGEACPPDADLIETRTCPKVNCRLSDWSDWSECEDGKKTRTRTVVEDAANGGDECPSERTQEHKCKANVVAPPPLAFASVV